MVYEKIYFREKNYFLKNEKKPCKSNNRDLNRDWIEESPSAWKEKHGKKQKISSKYHQLVEKCNR